jgi:hypothetical protein
MNQFSGFSRAVIGGHHGMIRLPNDAAAKPILGKGGKPIVFPTEAESLKAVLDHMCTYVNGHLRRDGCTIQSNQAAIERVFRKGRMIPVEHR